jgi:hypothetical protein
MPDKMHVCQIRPSDNRVISPAENRRVFSVVEGVVLYLAMMGWNRQMDYLPSLPSTEKGRWRAEDECKHVSPIRRRERHKWG